MKPTKVVITCEHGGNEVPSQYRALFHQAEDELNSHRALDYGAYEIASQISKIFCFDFAYTLTTRLLIDCNRSLRHPQCFSEFSKPLPKAEKQILIEQYYLPYRNQVENYVKTHIDGGSQVLHISVHSFVPSLNGKLRNAAIGLLYHPAHHGEKEVARIWSSLLTKHPPAYRVRMNYPYRGQSDGLTSTLRNKYAESQYLGIELELNQSILQEDKSTQELIEVLQDTIKNLLQLL
jgi:predicted N-formylglutamate amidohydrolase